MTPRVTEEPYYALDEQLSSDATSPAPSAATLCGRRCYLGECLDASAIIAVSAVGAGFLVIPTITDPLGVAPTAVGLLCAWMFLAAAGVAYVEAASRILHHGDDLRGGGGASVFAVVRHCFGMPAAVAASAVFLVQMVATVTANLAKAAELLEGTMHISYFIGCLAPPLMIGALVFGAPRALAQRTNTVLTAAMVLGFVALFVSTLREPKTTEPLRKAHWDALLPQHDWVFPIFLNTIRFGEGVPVVVESLGPRRRRTARAAVLFGSALPLVLAVLWATVASVVAPAKPRAADPVLALVTSPNRSVRWSARFVAAGAVGGHLIEVYLTCSQLAADALRSCAAAAASGGGDASSAAPSGRATRAQRAIGGGTNLVIVALPAALSIIGPQIYLPLLQFAGGFPTTLLYGLLPPLAALSLARHRLHGKAGERGAAATVAEPTQPIDGASPSLSAGSSATRSACGATDGGERLLSDGTHVVLALLAVAILCTSAVSYAL